MASTLTPEWIENQRNIPAAAQPEGVTPNFDHPPNRNQLAIMTIALSLFVTTIACLIRAYAKIFCTRKARLEDFLGLISYPFFIAGTWSLAKVVGTSGYFVHQWDVRVGRLEGFLFAGILSTTLYCAALLLVKAAILLEWSHIFVPRPNRNSLWWLCCGLLITNVALYISTIAYLNSICSPQEKAWRPYIPGRCYDFHELYLSIVIVHLIVNLLMLLLPHTVIWKLSLNTRQKIGISIIFSVGILGCALAAGRVAGAINLRNSPDKAYAYSQYLMWSIAEVATAELIFCVPAFPLAFRPPNPLHTIFTNIRSKITTTNTLDRASSFSTVCDLPGDRSQIDKHDYRHTWQDNGCDTSLTELKPYLFHWIGDPPYIPYDIWPRGKFATISPPESNPNLRVIQGNAHDIATVSKCLLARPGVLVDQIVSTIGGAFVPSKLSIDDPKVCRKGMDVLLKALAQLRCNGAVGRPHIVVCSTAGISRFSRDISVALVPFHLVFLKVPGTDMRGAR